MDLPPDTADDIACVLEYTSSSKEEFDAYILDTFQRMHMPLVKCSRKSRVQVVEGRVVKEICTQKYRCDLGGRPTPKKDGVKPRRSKSKRLDCPFSFNATMLKSTRAWAITEDSKAKVLSQWTEPYHGHCHVLDDQHLRERKLNPDSDYHKDESSLRYTRATTSTNMTTAMTAPSSSSSPESLSNLMEQSSSIITALLKAEELESSAKDERIKQAVQEHATSLRLALEKLTAKIKSKYN
ncbi:hypothetical protein LEN26_004613 [Aphanomyces euteiches]|nr:hypothetical protein AeMF1_019305 [Aphanomyces euteiches]KAH9148081.1 hypothetical protein LEN26_004613 [Aphanomyces euteiches]KAH9194042.1 hypothetical protein AeNC1_003986 [Aphanomyces euteiches]